MNFLLFEVGILSLVFNISFLYKLRFELGINLVNLSLIILTYFYGLFFNDLQIILVFYKFTFYISMIFSISIFVYTFQKRRFFVFRNIITAGLIFYITIFTLTYISNYRVYFNEWDEFTHWGLSIKNMFYYMSFARDSLSNIVAVGYPPGSNIYQLISHVFSNHFVEYYAIQSHISLIIGFLSLFFLNYRKEHFLSILTFFIGIIYIVLHLDISIFSEIYVDSLLGVTFSISIFLTLKIISRNFKGTFIEYLLLLLLVIYLPIIKNTGYQYALLLSLSFLISIILKNRNELNFRIISSAIFPFLLVFVTNYSWNVYISSLVVGYSGQISNSIYNFKNIVAVFNWNLIDKPYQITTIWNFIHTVLLFPIQIFFPISYFAWWLVFMFINIKLFWKKDRSLFVFNLLLLLGFILYLFSILIFFVYGFGEYESVNLASIHRYILSYILPMFMTYAYFLTNEFFFDRKYELLIIEIYNKFISSKFHSVIKYLLYFMIISFMFLNINFNLLLDTGKYEYTFNTRERFHEFEDFITINNIVDSRIYFIAENSNGYEYWVARYLATPNKFPGNGSWSIGDKYNDTDIWTNPHTIYEWEAAIIEGKFDYIFLYNIDEYFVDNFGGLFINRSEIENNTWYEVLYYDDGRHISLNKIDYTRKY